MAEDRKREQALPPGTHAFVLDGTKGSIKTHVGPCTLTLTNQDEPVRFDTTSHTFVKCTLEQAVQKNIVAPEGYYVVLTNPAKSKEGKDIHPEQGRPNDTPDMLIGQKENVPGPVDFALYPGQKAEVRRGHHLRLNEYLRIKIYNEEKAKQNWSKAVLKVAEGATPPAGTSSVVSQMPSDLAVGKQYNVRGDQVSFYIPPTGVSVVPDGIDDVGKPSFVRDAETLEQLEYAILVDEDGNKEYPRGPHVVFPLPTQRFLLDTKGNRKFRAVEMNELQGIHLKFITDGELTYADGKKEPFHAGEEKFITGKEMPIYYPEEGHQLVRYDGKTIHYAAAVPEGEARYVMNRKTGDIRTVKGPTMLLPNPVTEIIVRRALSDGESVAWFPGPDGMGSRDALAYNRMLRDLAGGEPTTRQGVVSDSNVSTRGASASGEPEMAFYASNASVDAFAEAARERGGGPTRRVTAKAAVMSESRQGKNQDAMVGDVAERKSTYNEPRTLTFANKYKGVPTIKVQPGYAVSVVDAEGMRATLVGPKTKLLEYDETLDVLSLSTGKPKSTDRLFKTAYLNIANNKVTDWVRVETQDLVTVELKLIYNVNFEGDSQKWFAIENYIKYLCDHVRSVLKGKVRKVRIEDFYNASTDMTREMILGAPGADGTKRPGMAFGENGMRITDVEVLGVTIVDETLARLFSQVQHQVVQQNISLAKARRDLEVMKESEKINRAQSEEAAETLKVKLVIDMEQHAAKTQLELARIEAEKQKAVERQLLIGEEQKALDIANQAELSREAAKSQQEIAADRMRLELNMQLIKTQTDAIVAQMKAVDPTLAAALESVSSRETLERVARSLSFHEMFGIDNGVDFVRKIFQNTPFQGLFDKTLEAASKQLNGNGSSKVTPANPPAA